MIRGKILGLVGFSQAKLQLLLHDFYTSPSFHHRIESLSNLPPHIRNVSVRKYHISVPQTFTLTNAKNLVQYHKDHKTPLNINILHALAFIQLNAFQAYADTFLRFACDPQQPGRFHLPQLELFYQEIRQIAVDEGQHCKLLVARLEKLGYPFGGIPVISSLAEIVDQTKTDLLQRLALIAIVHQGRGMRAVSKLIQKIQSCNDMQSAGILKKIESQEKDHFENGLKWFKCLLWDKLHIEQGKKELSLEESLKVTQYLGQINTKYRVNIQLSDIQVVVGK